MYENHWQLTGRPFENSIEADAYYPAETHEAAILKLRYAIENRRSAALLCGHSGMGKTLVVEALSQQLPEEIAPVSHIVFPQMSSGQLLRYIVSTVDGGQDVQQSETAADVIRLENFFQNNLEQAKHAVIVIDEAHLLEQNELLEPLRLLLNIGAASASGESAWTLVLVGQPVLISHVERNQALDERMSVKCMLNRLLLDETIAYIDHRMANHGGDINSVFEYTALTRIHALSEGVPRRINRLCDLALMVGYAEERDQIDVELIESVHGELAAPRAA